jgi:hypothetical protein
MGAGIKSWHMGTAEELAELAITQPWVRGPLRGERKLILNNTKNYWNLGGYVK